MPKAVRWVLQLFYDVMASNHIKDSSTLHKLSFGIVFISPKTQPLLTKGNTTLL